ncbi:MAG: hypothetical protein ACLFP1_07890 [Candidatus Goldiibacteriota bacterium]
MKKTAAIITVLALVMLYSCGKTKTELKDRDNYSVRVINTDIRNFQKAADARRKLEKNGYISYYDTAKKKDGRIYVMAAAGCYPDKAAAEKAAGEIEKNTELKGAVIKADLEIKGDLIKTPSGLWEPANGSYREKEKYKIPEIEMYKKRIPGTSSFDGRYNAWIQYEYDEQWESPSSIWISEYGSPENRELITTKDGNKPKSFQWHPYKHIIFYVSGYMFGTVSRGGQIFMSDMKGNTKIAVGADPDSRMEIKSDFTVENGRIKYKLLKFDKNYLNYETTRHSLEFDKIPHIHKNHEARDLSSE